MHLNDSAEDITNSILKESAYNYESIYNQIYNSQS